MCPAESALRLATYQDLLALPEAVRAEVVAGQIVTAPSPLPEHSWAAGALAQIVGGPFGHGAGPGGWWILAEVDVQLGEHDVVRPDYAGWRRERLPEPWGVRPLTVVPDWVCEILSPSNADYDRAAKADLYAAKGVQHYWLVDPQSRVLEAYVLTDGRWLRLGAWGRDAVVRVPPFDEVELNVGRLFPPGLGS